MNCVNHLEVPSVVECAVCKRHFCPACAGNIGGDPVCTECAKEAVKRYKDNTNRNVSPAAAAWLAVIPCVGAIYNGTYVKAFYQFLGFVAIHELLQNQLGFGIPANVVFYVYTIVDAYRTAKALNAGTYRPEPLPFESRLNMNMVKGAILVLIGCLFLLNNLDFDLEFLHRYWPVLIILAGIYMVFVRGFGENRDEADLTGTGPRDGSFGKE